jgi:hypothetical protein
LEFAHSFRNGIEIVDDGHLSPALNPSPQQEPGGSVIFLIGSPRPRLLRYRAACQFHLFLAHPGLL